MSKIPDNVLNKELYKKAKDIANKTYGDKTSAYKSMYIVSTYKKLGGEYKGKQKKIGTTRWNEEKWVNVNDYLKGKNTACGESQRNKHACRPSKRINKETPITIQEVIKKFGKQKTKKLANLKKTEGAKNVRINWEKGTSKMI